MYAGTQSRAQIGWTRKHEAQMFVPHKLGPSFFHEVLGLLEAGTESFKYIFHVPAFLHRDYPDVIFFVDPDEEIFVLVVPDSCHNKIGM